MQKVNKDIIGSRLSTLRQSLGMTQNDLAIAVTEIVGKSIGVPTISSWETGNRSVPDKFFRALCDIFSCSPSYLTGLSDSPDKDIPDTENQSFDDTIEIRMEELPKYDKRPVFVVFLNHQYEDSWALYDDKSKNLYFLGSKYVSTASSSAKSQLKLYLQRPTYQIDNELNGKKMLDMNSMMKCEMVFIIINSSDAGIRGKYNGWYTHNEDHSCLINEIGLTLPYSGLGISYKAYTPNVITSK